MKICPQCDTEHPSHHSICPTDGAVLIEVRSWEPGTIVKGKYRILALVGRGGMGIVYKAEHIGLEEVRALKVMSSTLCGDPAFAQRFRREAQAARKLHHANAVHVDDLDQAEDGSLFIAMDYVDGGTLGKLLDSTAGPLPIERALDIARGIAEGLAAAHALGMVHRDIKPDNIVLARDRHGRDLPKILDFGIVAMKESSNTRITRGPLLTPDYAPPEQWRGTPASELDGRADLYALGCVLYEMLTGQTPFHAHNYEGWMFQHLTETPKPPSALQPELAQRPGLDALVLKLLAKDREARPASAQAFIEELERVEARHRSAEPTRRKTEVENPDTLLEPTEDANACYALGLKYWHGEGVAQNDTEAARWFRKAADQGDPEAQATLGYMYLQGQGVGQDDVEAVRWYRKAAEQGGAIGQYNLGVCYGAGQGVAQNDSEAVCWYRKAAEQGDPDAQFALGRMYQQGRGVGQDDVEAVRWFRMAAEQENADAQASLGYRYQQGQGVGQDDVEAFRWYRKAAEQGAPDAQNLLGNCYAMGRGVGLDDQEAVHLYRKAAEQGDAYGEYNLAGMYESGKGLERDLPAALYWYQQAADQGLAPAGLESAADACNRLRKKGILPARPPGE